MLAACWADFFVCIVICCWVQVVFSGPMNDAGPFFKEVGFVPDQLRSNIADYMLDLVIRADHAEVASMVQRFAG